MREGFQSVVCWNGEYKVAINSFINRGHAMYVLLPSSDRINFNANG